MSVVAVGSGEPRGDSVGASDDSYTAAIAELVAQAPPLSPEQRDHLEVLFRPEAQEAGEVA